MPNSIWRESLSRSILDLVEDKANIGSWSWDLESGEMNWSVGVYRIFALSPGDAPEISLISSLIDGSDAAALRSLNPLVVARLLADRKFTIRRRDGEVRTVHSHGKLIAPEGGHAQFVGAFLDITDSRLDDELYLLKEALLDSMRQLFDVVIWQTDVTGTYSDPMQWRMALGREVAPEGLGGRLEMVHPDDREAVNAAWVEARANGKVYSSDCRMMVGHSYVAAHSRAVSLLDGTGEILGWIGYTKWLDNQPASPSDRANSDPLSSAQIRAARGYLNWTGRTLAERASVSFSSVRRAESDEGQPVSGATLSAIRQALERAGLSFRNRAGGVEIVFGPAVAG